MSDNTERKKNDSLTSKTIEEEKKGMQQALLDIGIYDAAYSYDEMKEILCFIEESKDMANMGSDNRNVQKTPLRSSNEHAPGETCKSNLSSELEQQDRIDTSCRIMHSHRPNRTSPTQERISSHDSSNLESTTYDSKNITQKCKSSDSKEMFERPHKNSNVRDSCSRSDNKRIPLTLRNSVQESRSTHTPEKMLNTQSEYNKKPDKWQINPLSSCTNENDVSLQQPERRAVEEREPFRSCKNVQTAEMLDKVLLALNHHLRRMAEVWYTWNHTADSKFQWGSPIQVGIANGSLDRKPLTGSTIEQNRIEHTSECNQENTCKRKLNLTVSPHERNVSGDEEGADGDDDDDDEAKFITIKKKKMQTLSVENKSHFSTSKQINNNDTLSPSQSKSGSDECAESSCMTIDLYDTDDRSQQIQQQQTLEDECSSQSPTSRYPRRIIPPNPKKGFNGPRKKKCNSTTSTKTNVATNRNQKAENSINEDSNKDNTSEKKPVDEKKNLEIKPLVLKNLSLRLERECQLLKLAQVEKEKKLETEREEAQRKEEEERKRKEEIAKKHMENIQLRHRQKEEAEKWVRERSTKWNNLIHAKSRENKERSRTLREQEEARIAEIEEENRLLQDSDMETEEDTSNNISCPICGKYFPSDMIETHAASCEQYNTDDDDSTNMNLRQNKVIPKKTSRKSEILECIICSAFRTTNGIDYEDHVTSCMQRQSASQDCASISIHNIPTSPIRCFRPISEQHDSEIDYRAQFASNSKTQTRPSRKRKR